MMLELFAQSVPQEIAPWATIIGGGASAVTTGLLVWVITKGMPERDKKHDDAVAAARKDYKEELSTERALYREQMSVERSAAQKHLDLERGECEKRHKEVVEVLGTIKKVLADHFALYNEIKLQVLDVAKSRADERVQQVTRDRAGQREQA